MSVFTYKKMRKKELKRLLKKRNIKISGKEKKDELIKLLIEEDEKKLKNKVSSTSQYKKEKQEKKDNNYTSYTNEEIIPERYNETKIVLLVRDPHWLFAYWDIADKKMEELQDNVNIEDSIWILRVHKIDEKKYFDISLVPDATNWYINVPEAGKEYQVEIGIKDEKGNFISIATSNSVATPPDTISDIIDEEWMIVEKTFNKIYQLAGGDKLGVSSEYLITELRNRLEKLLSSESISSSFSLPYNKKKGKDNFYLVVKTDLVIYGETEPDAELYFNNNKIKLNKDGTFSFRIMLPEGENKIEIKSISKNKKQQRTSTSFITKENL